MEVENNRLRARQRDQGHYRWRRKGGRVLGEEEKEKDEEQFLMH